MGVGAAGEGWTIEPQASLGWTETDLNAIEGEAGRVEFGGTTSVLGKAGVRLSRAFTAGYAVVQPYVGLHRMREFDGENVSRIVLAAETLEVADQAPGAWTQLTMGADFGVGRIQGFAQGEALFGKVEGYAARLGVSINW